MKKTIFFVVSFLFFLNVSAQPLYYPPIEAAATWETTNPSDLGWCEPNINSLYTFLEQQNTKGFIVLKNGKIVLEHYFGTFTAQNLWYWASAGKTITSFLVGKASEENYLSLNDKTSDYLGVGWTNCSVSQENNITIRNQLTMTTGLDDGVVDNHCTQPSCLNYLADPGNRWAYHNAPYTLLENVLQNATGQSINTYTQTKLKNPTGMTGIWNTVDFDNVFFSTVRSMARFGVLIQGDGKWNGNQLINPLYYHDMLNSSQNLNASYGYLWWLNGKSNFMVPTSQFVFPGSYSPDAPSDMVAAIGKNGQILSISKEQNLVFVRMGDAADNSEVPFVLCNQIWQYINSLDCAFGIDQSEFEAARIFPNPAQNVVNVSIQTNMPVQLKLMNAFGEIIKIEENCKQMDVANLSKGIYFIELNDGKKSCIKKFIKI